MFFDGNRAHFFRPLTGKYRARVCACLNRLYARVFSSSAEYAQSLTRDQILEIFQEAWMLAPDLDGESEGIGNERERATWVLNRLLEHGWLERRVDEATLATSFALTRPGRLFCQALSGAERVNFRTRHRNTRNTRNSLTAFLRNGEAFELLDAWEFSERIVSDFSDIIAELEERTRDLVQEVEAHVLVQTATDQFFDFMERRFEPDLAVRLSADSVEKHRDEIRHLIQSIKRKPTAFKRDAELRLRQLAPDLIRQGKHSLLYELLDGIEQRLKSACEVMLPQLRAALRSFTRRADIIIRQLSYLAGQQEQDIEALCRDLAAQSPEEQDRRLNAAAEAMAGLQVRLIDPGLLRLREGRVARVLNNRVDHQHTHLTPEARRELVVQQALDQAFSINHQGLRDYVKRGLLHAGEIHISELPVDSAHDLLAWAHAIELGAVGGQSSEFRVQVTPTGETLRDLTYFLRADGFHFQVIEADAVAAPAAAIDDKEPSVD